MTSKSLPQLAVPLVISFTTRFLFSLVDMAFAAEFVGKAGVAAIAYFLPFQMGYIALWVGLSGGYTASLSAAFGHRDEERIGQLRRAMLRFLAALSPTLVVLGAAHHFALPLHTPGELVEHFRPYCTTMLCGMAVTGFWAIHPDSLVKAHHDTRSTMNAGLISSFTNIGLNVVLVALLGMGMLGLALATVLSRLPSLLYALHRSRVLEARRRGESWEPIPTIWRRPLPAILALAVPGSLTFVLTAVESGTINTVLKGMPDATTKLASYGVFERLLSLSLMPAAGCAVAVVPFAARLLPQGGVDRVRHDLVRTLGGLTLLGLVVTVLLGWLLARPLAGFFLDEVPPAGTVQALHLLPLTVLGSLPFYLLRPLFEAAQQPRIGIALSSLRFLGLSVPLVVLAAWLAPRAGIDGLLAVLLGITIAAVLASATGILWGRRLLNRY